MLPRELLTFYYKNNNQLGRLLFFYIYRMVFYFVYETTNIINGKKYRGIHKTVKINDGYLGSGIALEKAIKKYGKQSFRREILEFCSSYDELLEREKFYVDEDWVRDHSNYNLKTGGQSAGILSQESRNKISETLKMKYEIGEIKVWSLGKVLSKLSDSVKVKISDTLKEKYKTQDHPLKGKIPWNKDKKGVQIAWNKGLQTGPQSEEVKRKKSETLKERFKNQEHHSKGVDPWNKGKKGQQVAWNKGKEMERVECPHCGKFCDRMNAKKWHFDKCKENPTFVSDSQN